MKTFVLLVTWIVSDQPPSSYQTNFFSAEACAVARDAVLADGRRLQQEHDQRQINAAKAIGKPPELFLSQFRPPAVSAVCVAQAQ
jgi:hypothetical protein